MGRKTSRQARARAGAAPHGAVGGFGDAWRHRRWRWLVVSYAVSLTGEFVASIALIVFVLDATGSATWVAAAAIAQVFADLALASVGGVLADRLDRRGLVRRLDLARSVVLGLLATLVWSNAPVAGVVAVAAIAAALGAPRRPAAIAATPVLVAEDDLVAANGVMTVVGLVSFFAGPGLGALLVAATSAGWALMVSAGAMVVSALLVSRAGDMGGGAPRAAALRSASTISSDVRAGVVVIRQDRVLVVLTAVMASVVFQDGVEIVLHVFVATERLGMSAAGVGVLAAATGIGAVATGPFTARLGNRRNAGLVLALAGAVTGLSMVALALTRSTSVAIVVLAVKGIAAVVFEVLWITMLQRSCAEGMLARVYGLQDSLSSGAQLLGSALAPLVLSALGLRAGLVVFGSITIVVTLLAAPVLAASSAQRADEQRSLAPVVDRLRALGIFGEASHAALERLARAAVVRPVSAGDVIFVEGDAPDDLYVVVSGCFEVVTGSTRVISEVGENDWFGEIGLLRGLARTATVRARTDGDLLAIPGRVFLAAFASPDVLPDALRRTMTHRLARSHPWLAGADAPQTAP